MAETKTYIVQYHMPLGLENPKINIPAPNQPEEFDLTEGDVVLLKKIVPDIKCVLANKKEAKAPKAEAEEETKAKPKKTDSEDSPKQDDDEESDEGDEAPEETSETESEDHSDTKGEGTALAEDFPGRDELIAHDPSLDTVEKVIAFSKESNLTDVHKVGAKTADSIMDFVMENHADLID